MFSNFVIVFDLDDTLYYELDFLKSAYKEISKELIKYIKANITEEEIFREMFGYYKSGKNPFELILKVHGIEDINKSSLIKIYREHIPNIFLKEDTKKVIEFFINNGAVIGIITDGRSYTQRGKIKALGLNEYIHDIIISEEIGYEKPNKENYIFFEKKYLGERNMFFYIGDNTKKDFITPNKLGWETICLLDKGMNIHKQDFTGEDFFLPKFKIKDIVEIKELVLKVLNEND